MTSAEAVPESAVSRLFNKAGGMGYHLRALLYRRKYWEDFRSRLNRWLIQWPQTSETVILVGPSAGYCLSDSFLRRYPRLIGIEVDPAARALFNYSHRKIEWIKVNLFIESNKISVRKFSEFVDSHPKSQILFCNFLGQLEFAFSAQIKDGRGSDIGPDLKVFRRQIARSLQNRSWASFHDRLSIANGPEPLVREFHDSRNLSNLELARTFWGERISGTILDHQTDELFCQAQPEWYLWRLTPTRSHIVECASHAPHPP